MPLADLTDLVTRPAIRGPLALKSTTGITAVALHTSAFTTGGTWAAFSTAATAAAGALCTRATTGAMPLPAAADVPVTPAFRIIRSQPRGIAPFYVILDRLWHYSHGTLINGAFSLASPVEPSAGDREDAQWFVEIATTVGAGAVTLTLGVTYEDLSTGTLTVIIPATFTAHRVFPIEPVAGKRIRRIDTCSGNIAQAGNVFLVCARPIAVTPQNEQIGRHDMFDPIFVGLRAFRTNACLMALYFSNTAAATGPDIMYELVDVT